jgi:hypothetical protein
MLSIERRLHEFMGRLVSLAVVINHMQNARGIVSLIHNPQRTETGEELKTS